MITNQEIAQKLRETAARLIKRAEELEAGIDYRKCQSGYYTGKPFTGCRTCGGKLVICSHPAIAAKQRNSKGCNPANCKYFTALKLNSLEVSDANKT